MSETNSRNPTVNCTTEEKKNGVESEYDLFGGEYHSGGYSIDRRKEK